MNEHCPVCDLKFEREEGYFLGADVHQLRLGFDLHHWTGRAALRSHALVYTEVCDLGCLIVLASRAFDRIVLARSVDILDQAIDPASHS